MFLQKDELSKYEFISWKEFFLTLFLLVLSVLFCFLGIPTIFKIIFPTHILFFDSHIFMTFAYVIFLLVNFYIIYFICGKRKNKTLQQAFFLYPKPPKTILISIFIGIMIPVLTSPLLMKMAPAKFYAANIVKEPGGLIFILIAGLSAPLLEEVFYRGFIFPFFQSKLNSFWAVIITSLFFGISHYSNVGNAQILVSLFIFYGFVITLVRYFTNSLIPSIVTHFTHNLTLISGFLILSKFKLFQ